MRQLMRFVFWLLGWAWLVVIVLVWAAFTSGLTRLLQEWRGIEGKQPSLAVSALLVVGGFAGMSLLARLRGPMARRRKGYLAVLRVPLPAVDQHLWETHGLGRDEATRRAAEQRYGPKGQRRRRPFGLGELGALPALLLIPIIITVNDELIAILDAQEEPTAPWSYLCMIASGLIVTGAPVCAAVVNAPPVKVVTAVAASAPWAVLTIFGHFATASVTGLVLAVPVWIWIAMASKISLQPSA
jgi:hypothetical protein